MGLLDPSSTDRGGRGPLCLVARPYPVSGRHDHGDQPFHHRFLALAGLPNRFHNFGCEHACTSWAGKPELGFADGLRRPDHAGHGFVCLWCGSGRLFVGESRLANQGGAVAAQTLNGGGTINQELRLNLNHWTDFLMN